MLTIIDTFLAKGNAESGKLWDVLTALRGPDFEDIADQFKETTTCSIRVTAFPKLAKRVVNFHSGPSGRYPGMSWKPFSIDPALAKSQPHFYQHTMGAAKVLELLR